MIIVGGFFTLTVSGTPTASQLGDLGVLSAEGNWVLSILGIYATFLGVILFLFGFLYLMTAYGLWQMTTEYRWAWWLALILSIFGLFSFPVGTILSLVILVCLWTIKDKYGVKITI